MDVKELRIGNYILGEWGNGYEDVITVDKDTFNKFGDFTYSAIPLTEEWLLKFGFENNELWIDNNEALISFYNGKLNIGVPYNMIGTNVKHVHQLQNLYFALTNEELTIK